MLLQEKEIIVIKEINGEQKLTYEKRLCRAVLIPRERYLASDIPVFEDRIEWVPI